MLVISLSQSPQANPFKTELGAIELILQFVSLAGGCCCEGWMAAGAVVVRAGCLQQLLLPPAVAVVRFGCLQQLLL